MTARIAAAIGGITAAKRAAGGAGDDVLAMLLEARDEDGVALSQDGSSSASAWSRFPGTRVGRRVHATMGPRGGLPMAVRRQERACARGVGGLRGDIREMVELP